jgi:hypothetical protein
MKSIYGMIAAGLLLCCFAVPGSAQGGDTQGAAGKTATARATGSLGSGSITGPVPVGAMGKTPVGVTGQVPVGAAGSLGSGGVSRPAPRGVMRRVYTGRTNDTDEEEEYEED